MIKKENKRGSEFPELKHILLALLLLAILVGAIIIFLLGWGTKILDAIKNFMRLGR